MAGYPIEASAPAMKLCSPPAEPPSTTTTGAPGLSRAGEEHRAREPIAGHSLGAVPNRCLPVQHRCGLDLAVGKDLHVRLTPESGM